MVWQGPDPCANSCCVQHLQSWVRSCWQTAGLWSLLSAWSSVIPLCGRLPAACWWSIVKNSWIGLCWPDIHAPRIIIIIIIAFKGSIRDVLQSPHCTVNRLQHIHTLKWPGRNRVQITYNTSSAYHMQRVTCHVVWRDSSAIKVDRVVIIFILALFYWQNY